MKAITNESTALVLPKPETIALTQVREILQPAIIEKRRQIETRGDIPAAKEMCRQLDAFRKYVQDKESRDMLAGWIKSASSGRTKNGAAPLSTAYVFRT